MLEADLFRAAYRHHEDALAEMGFSSTPSHEMHEWRMYMESWGIPRNPAFDKIPHQILNAENSGYIRVMDDKGPCAVIALRYFQGVKNLGEFLASGRLWSPPALAALRDVQVALPADMLNISGALFHPGGLAVHKRAQGNGIGKHLARMVRYWAFGTWGADHAFGLETVEMATADGGKMPLSHYGFQYVSPEPVLRALEIGQPARDYHLTWQSREDALKSLCCSPQLHPISRTAQSA